MPVHADLRVFAEHILEQQPFSALLGIRLSAIEPGSAELRLDLKPTLLQQHGIAHGGLVAALADTALAFAGGSVLGDMVTAEFKVNYLQPAEGERLIARAEVIHHSNHQAVCQCRVFFQQEGREGLCAVSQGTIRRAPGSAVQL